MKTLQTVLPAVIQRSSARTERVRRFVDGSMPDNTKKAYQQSWSAFEMFCLQNDYRALPATPDAIVDYITLMATAGRKVATIEQAMAAITWVHRSANHPNPRDDAKVRQALKGIRIQVGTAPKRKEPVLRKQLKNVLDAQGSDLRGIRNRAVLLCGWMGAFRRSELVALDVEDVRFTDDGAVITLQRSKTDQEGAGMQKHLPKQKNPTFCAATALRYWLNASEIESGPLFRAITKWGKVRGGYMNGKEVARIIKQAANLAGLDSKLFSGHSLRAGFVTQAAINGAATWQIAEQTGHKPNSPVLNAYIRSAGRGAKSAVASALQEPQS